MSDLVHLKEMSLNYLSNDYVNWLNDEETNKYLLQQDSITYSDLKEYILKKMEKKNCLFYAIICNKTNNHIGNIKLEPIDFKKGLATIGIIIGNKDYWNKGYGTNTIELIIKNLKKLKISTLNLSVSKENIPAIKLYTKLGFKIIDDKYYIGKDTKNPKEAYIMEYP